MTLDLALLRAHGEHAALAGVAAEVSYRAFAGRAEAVRDALCDVGLVAGDRVALLSSSRRHDEPVALAGVLGGGFTAVPLDASAPPLRLASLLRDRGCRALVHDDAATTACTRFAGELALLELDGDGHVLSSRGAAPGAESGDAALACILHTSGSTGQPKPIPIDWRGLDVFTTWMIELCALGPSDRVLRVAELVFDLAWFDHLASWRAGATLLTMSRRELTAARSLREAVERLRPTVVYAVPAMLAKLVSAGAKLEARAICFAGEVYPPRDLRALAEAAPHAALYNLYGPTETNVCTYHAVDRAALDGERELPIGVACPYASCSLVGESGAVVSGPGTGELVVEGPTALGGRVATRDRVERGADGLFYFRGRIDRMVKIRGYRVEPGEVEAALSAHARVREAAVLVWEHPRLGKVLRAAVSVRPGAETIDERKLRAFLAERLAPYLVPERIELRDALPRTTTGKIDYGALA